MALADQDFDFSRYQLQLGQARESSLDLDWSRVVFEPGKHPRGPGGKFSQAQALEAHFRSMPHGSKTKVGNVTVERKNEMEYHVSGPGNGGTRSAYVGSYGGGLPADWNHGEPQAPFHGAESAAWKAATGEVHADPNVYRMMKSGAIPPVDPDEHHARRLALRKLDPQAERAHAELFGRLRPASSGTHPSHAEHQDLSSRLDSATRASSAQNRARDTTPQSNEMLSADTEFDHRRYALCLDQLSDADPDQAEGSPRDILEDTLADARKALSRLQRAGNVNQNVLKAAQLRVSELEQQLAEYVDTPSLGPGGRATLPGNQLRVNEDV